MDKWKRTLDDQVPEGFEERILRGVRPALKENAEIFAQERASAGGFRWFWLAAPGLAAAALVFVMVQQKGAAPTVVALQVPLELELALDYDMYRDLEEIEKLELLQELGDPGKWPSKAKKAPKS